jgi:hypothetical protein
VLAVGDESGTITFIDIAEKVVIAARMISAGESVVLSRESLN